MVSRGAPLVLVLALPLASCKSAKMGDREMASAAAMAKEEASDDGGGPGEVTTWQRSAQVPHSSTLKVGEEESLPLTALHARVQVDGFRARVVLDYYYENPHDRRLEGTFKVRLPDGASPYYFAFGETRALAPALGAATPMDVAQARAQGSDPEAIAAARKEAWKEPKVARMVPKVKAAQAYGDTVREQIDPALLEWAGAGVFNARVFPLAPRHEHRIVFAYDVDLIAAGDDLELAFDLPEKVPNLVVDFDVAELPKGAQTLTPEVPGEAYNGRVYYRMSDPKEKTIRLRLEEAPTLVLSGEDPATGPYFATSFVPPLPEVKSAARARRAVFLVDTSLSANPDGFNVWLRLLEALLAENRDTIGEFAVLYFNVEATWWKQGWTANTPEASAELLADARSLVLEGATDLAAALGRGAHPPWVGGDPAPIDLFLLSDGASTWGEGSLFTMAAGLGEGRTLFAYRTGLSGTDGAALDLLARESGGAVFSVVGEAEVQAAARAHRATPWRFLDATYEGAADLLIAGRPRALFPGQRLKVVGRGQPPAEAPLRLRVQQGAEAPRELVIKPDAALASNLAARTYGEVAVAHLEEIGQPTEEPAAAYAMHFRVTGQTASLLMLESEEDYQRRGISPQADALVVQRRQVAALVAAALDEIGALLGDPKARFLAWLAGLPTRAGVEIAIPTALKVILEDLPPGAFEVPVEPLQVRGRHLADLKKPYLDHLRAHDFAYADVVDEAEARGKAFGPDDAIRALSSLVEENPGDAVLARDVGYATLQRGRGEQAYHLFRRVAESRPYEPETYRAIARALERAGKPELALAFFEIGLAGRWDSRFGDYAMILRYDYARFLGRLVRGELKSSLAGFAGQRLQEIGGQVALGSDLVVMITWNTDNTDVDLHVIEPSGEECFYSHPRTRSGGQLSADVTRGYGPEMYVLPKAKKGRYEISAHYFASDRNRLSARTKVQALVFEGFGTPHEKVRERIVTLEVGKDRHVIDTIEVGQAIAR